MLKSTLVKMTAAATPSGLNVISNACVAHSIKRIWPLPLPPPIQFEGIDPSIKKPTLLLDIDETLIHTFDFQRVQFEDDSNNKVPVMLVKYVTRPYLEEFLKFAMKEYEVIFWTAGTAEYAASVIDGIERHVLGLPMSIYNAFSMMGALEQSKSGKAAGNENRQVNFYFLARDQTLVQKDYMKYIPMVGRPLKSSVIIDDNVRSFPLTPRNGILINEFGPKDVALKEEDRRGKHYEVDTMYTLTPSPENMAKNKLGDAINDRGLLNLIPLLQDLADAFKKNNNVDLGRQLDYWRSSNYVETDDFKANFSDQRIRYGILGRVEPQKNEHPIPEMVNHIYNVGFVEDAKEWMRVIHSGLKHPSRSKL